MTSNFYLLAAQLPLLQGLGADVLLDWQSEHVLRVVTVDADEGVIIGQGDTCQTLTFLAEGSLERITVSPQWTLTETLHAPAVIEEEALWSLGRRYRHTYRSCSEARLLVASKDQVMRTMIHNQIFRMNLLMRLSTRLERAGGKEKVEKVEKSKEGKILSFVESISTTPSYPKSLKIKMTTLASILEERRLTISNALHSLEKQGIVELQREKIIIYRRVFFNHNPKLIR